MDIRQLRYFVEIAKCQSFSQAAEICYISTQGINMSIIRLENELGYTLFRRTRKGIVLTPEGEFLLPRAKKILSLIDECDTYFSKDDKVEQVLPVAASDGTIEEFAGTTITSFRRAHPEISLSIRECCDTDCDEYVLNQEVELGLTVGDAGDDLLDRKLLFTSHHAIIVPKEHPLANKKSVTIADIRDIPVCMMNQKTRSYSTYYASCTSAGWEPKISLFADNILLVFYMAQSQNMVGISTMHLAQRLSMASICAIPFQEESMNWNVYLIKRKDTRLSRSARLFERDLLQQADSINK